MEIESHRNHSYLSLPPAVSPVNRWGKRTAEGTRFSE